MSEDEVYNPDRQVSALVSPSFLYLFYCIYMLSYEVPEFCWKVLNTILLLLATWHHHCSLIVIPGNTLAYK